MRRSSNGNRKRRKNSNTLLYIIMTLIVIVIIVSSFALIKNTILNKDTSTETAKEQNSSSSKTNEDGEKENKSQKENDSSEDKDSKNNTVEQKETTFNMLVTGDIMCHNTMYKDAFDSSTNTYDFSYMFDDIKYYIQTADIAVGNLETTFAGSKVGYSNYPTFNTPEQLATALKKAGFDVVSTANNHCMDKGYSGLVSTIEYLDKSDIAHTGTFASEEDSKKVLIQDVKGVKVAFLSYTYGTNGIPVPQSKSYAVNLIDENLMLEQIELAKKENPDMICACMHWGVEYQTKQNSTQEKLADFLFNNGVDVIIGNHPHVPQPMEKRTISLDDGSTKDVFVIYSLGNFMADQNAKYTRDSALLNLNITKNSNKKGVTINSATYTPIYYYKNTAVSKKRFKHLDIEKTIEAYDAGADTSIGKTMYNTLVTELKNIKSIIGDEIK